MNLSTFLNPIAVESKKVVISKRFVENGMPVEWEIKAISAEQDAALRKMCTRKEKKNANLITLDVELYIAKLMAASVVYPDVQNVELQNAYHVMNGEDLLQKMLTSGEYAHLGEQVKQVNDFDKDLEELVDEAKN